MSRCRSREHAGQKRVQTLQKRIFQMKIMMHVFLFGQVPGLCPVESPVNAQTDDNPPDLDNHTNFDNLPDVSNSSSDGPLTFIESNSNQSDPEYLPPMEFTYWFGWCLLHRFKISPLRMIIQTSQKSKSQPPQLLLTNVRRVVVLKEQNLRKGHGSNGRKGWRNGYRGKRN